MVRTERTDTEPRRIDADRLQLRARAVSQVSREEPENDIRMRLERGEQRKHAGQNSWMVSGGLQLGAKSLNVEIEHGLHSRVDVMIPVTGETHHITHDLRVGLPVEAIIGRHRDAENFEERMLNRSPAGTVGPHERAVDVEEDELHELDRDVRARRTPIMTPAAPQICQTPGSSRSAAHATSIAKTG